MESPNSNIDTNRGFNFYTDKISINFANLNIDNNGSEEKIEEKTVCMSSSEFRQRRTHYRCRYCSEKFTSRLRYLNHNHDKLNRSIYISLMQEVFKVFNENRKTDKSGETDGNGTDVDSKKRKIWSRFSQVSEH